MRISKSFDVSIRVIYPHISTNITKKDSERINASTFFKYEAPESAAAPELSYEKPAEVKEESRIAQAMQSLENTYNDLERLEKRAEKSLEDLYLEYDPRDPDNDALADAERDLFGYASGKITFAMYKEVLEFEEALDEEIRLRTVENNGEFKISA